MSQISERTAEQLTSAQATELAAVIDAQARWENLRGEPPHAGDNSATALQGRQKAYEAFRTKLVAYTAHYRTTQVPEPTLNTLERLGEWCRGVRAILRREDTTAPCPGHVVAKAFRLADRIAARLGTAPVGRGSPPNDLAGAIFELGAVIAWCETASGTTPLVLKVPELYEKVA